MQIYQFGVIKERTTRDPNKFIVEGAVCKIECYDMNGDIKGYAIIDLEDMEKCTPYKWGIAADGYAATSNVGKAAVKLLHIANFPEQSNSSPLRKCPKPAKILYF